MIYSCDSFFFFFLFNEVIGSFKGQTYTGRVLACLSEDSEKVSLPLFVLSSVCYYHNSVKKNVKCLLIIVLDLLLFIFAGCGCIFFMYYVCKKWISNLLACLLLPIKMEEWGACKKMREKRKKYK